MPGLGAAEDRAGRKFVFVGNSDHVFVKRTAEELSLRGIPVSIIDPFELVVNRRYGYSFRQILHSARGLMQIVRDTRALDRDTTAVIHFISIYVLWLVPLLRRRGARVVGFAWGSDILRRKRKFDPAIRRGLRACDCLAATNGNVMEAMIAAFPELGLHDRRIVRFGLPVLDEIDRLEAEGVSTAQAKQALGYQPETTLVSLGYAAVEGQRQLDLIEFFAARATSLPGVDFVVPVQYGAQDVRASVERSCARANDMVGDRRFHALTEFHDLRTSAVMRKATDVLINHSVTDAFSGTVQEVAYAGNLVLAGRQLPYETMPGFGRSILPYDTLDDCIRALERHRLETWASEAGEHLGTTREGIASVSSWRAVIGDWVGLLAPPEHTGSTRA